tara:strand:+ start:1227 stop:1634 length:408 start_codon:yes stop_codon:yes gene_type:complete
VGAVMTAKKPSVDDFIKEYILTGCKNGTKAAISAGYSEKTADQQASRLLKNVKVRTAIEEYKKADLKLFIKTKEQKLKMLEDIAKACMLIDDEKGMVNAQAAISAIKEHNVMQGDNAPTLVDNTHKIITADDQEW